MNLHGIATLVTGASQGLGRALAKKLAGEGSRVVLVARHIEALDQVVAEIRASGGTAHALAADVGDKNATYPLAGAAAALVGPIELVIHNASTLGTTPLPLLLDTECEDFERVLAVNVLGPFRLTKVFAGAMALRGHGTVVTLSSDAAVEAYPRWGAYGVSKAALDHLTRIWSEELRASGVRFLAIDPGEMDTQMHGDAIPDADRASLARPEDVAERIVRLLKASNAAPPNVRVSASSLDAGVSS